MLSSSFACVVGEGRGKSKRFDESCWKAAEVESCQDLMRSCRSRWRLSRLVETVEVIRFVEGDKNRSKLLKVRGW